MKKLFNAKTGLRGLYALVAAVAFIVVVVLNIVMGLCVGHDILFAQRSAAPCTTLVVKDRALVHNPVAALHAACGPSPYNRMLKQHSAWRA